jgi:hypothetical protein
VNASIMNLAHRPTKQPATTPETFPCVNSRIWWSTHNRNASIKLGNAHCQILLTCPGLSPIIRCIMITDQVCQTTARQEVSVPREANGAGAGASVEDCAMYESILPPISTVLHAPYFSRRWCAIVVCECKLLGSLPCGSRSIR